MAQLIKALAVELRELSSIPSTHKGKLAQFCIISETVVIASLGLMASGWMRSRLSECVIEEDSTNPRPPHVCIRMCVHTHTHVHIHDT